MTFFVILIFVVALMWTYQFVQLMMLNDAVFPATHDKLLWVVAFVVVIPLAPLAFLYWKRAYLSLRMEEREAGRRAV